MRVTSRGEPFTPAIPVFIMPYTQPLLGGELGLTAHDLARGLGTQPGTVSQKIRRGVVLKLCRSLGGRVVEYAYLYNDNLSQARSWVFDIEAALYFLASYQNYAGWAYLKFLKDHGYAFVIQNIERTHTDEDDGSLPVQGWNAAPNDRAEWIENSRPEEQIS